MRIRTWVDLSAHGMELKLLQGKSRLDYCVVPMAGTVPANEALAPHAAGLQAMGFRQAAKGRPAFFHEAQFTRDRPTNQPEQVDFVGHFPGAVEIPFDKGRHFMDLRGAVHRPAPVAVEEAREQVPALAEILSAVHDHGAGAADQATLDRLMAATVGFARSQGLDADAAYEDAQAPAPRM